MSKLFLTLFVVSLSSLSGCSAFNPGGSSDFACPGMPKGVVCKTPREVYNKTDSASGKKSKANKMPSYIFASQPKGADDLNPTPVLEQARVMRIWIAPWVDSNKDLHWPGIMFTQIQPRQWHFGSEEFNGVEPPVPHRSFAPAPVNKQGVGKNVNPADQPNQNDVLN
jgi:conjugal transfer pilus assembly protein TraV